MSAFYCRMRFLHTSTCIVYRRKILTNKWTSGTLPKCLKNNNQFEVDSSNAVMFIHMSYMLEMW